jgi:CheY-specific phosphatase CheX
MPAICKYSTKDFLSPRTQDELDETLIEVFGTMLGMEIAPTTESSVASSDETFTTTGLVGFAAPGLRGSCEIRLDKPATMAMTSAMMGGMPPEEMDDDTLNDAVGELCNIVTAGWKNRVADLSSDCALSIPSVISGGNYHIQVRTVAVRITRTYSFGGHAVQVALYCEDVTIR